MAICCVPSEMAVENWVCAAYIAPEPPAFIPVFKTTTASESITLPTTSNNNNYTVNWGDGSATEDIVGSGTPSHIYSLADEYQVSITGTCPVWNFSSVTTSKDKIINVIQWGSVGLVTAYYMFYNCKNLTNITATDIFGNGIFNFRAMFKSSGLVSLNASNWIMSSGATWTSLYDMFDSCSDLITLDVYNWDTSKVNTMYQTWRYCGNLVNFNISPNWDTSKVNSFYFTFSYCTSILSLDLRNWSSRNSISCFYTFGSCTSMHTLNIADWGGSIYCDDWVEMFENCQSLSSFTATSTWNFGSSSMCYGLFQEDVSLTSLDLSSWNVTNITWYERMFDYCIELVTIDVSTWSMNPGDYADFSWMFYNCWKLKNIDVSAWTFSSDIEGMGFMFRSCYALESLDISNWDMTHINWINGMFQSCSSLISMDLTNWNVPILEYYDFMFQGCTSLVYVSNSGMDTLAGLEFDYMFDECSALTCISQIDTTNQTTTNQMFDNCISLASPDATAQAAILAGTNWVGGACP